MTSRRGLLLSDDLIFSSKVLATAKAHDCTVRVCRSCDSLVSLTISDPPAGLILDLHFPCLDLPQMLAQLRAALPVLPRIIGYGSHVDVATLKAARQAGLDRVMPRSQFVDELEDGLAQWLS
jgi:DNA-binding NarL/FixJ family response regulator